ncbi:MAG: major facilitator super transporter protein [Bathelium mastoideum]|nr:MAG: major facilitator super transporter protein [Bathelium mastoideum]
MPRVKALTTGSIPSFLDVILNFAESDTTSTLAGQDTWLAQLRTKGPLATRQTTEEGERAAVEEQQQDNSLVFYGDDTWLKLFPDFFKRADGTSSFFVSVSHKAQVIAVLPFQLSTPGVDNNVTRHIATELQQSDWNGLIMHYLGLDHIGHKAGPRSPNMLPKQREMDGIVETIYNAITDPEQPHLHRTLLVLCGDHGMNDGGNHGGSSEGETSPALTFISPLLEMISNRETESPTANHAGDCCGYYETVEQSDVVPTLAGLLGMPVSRNNLGVFIDGLLGFWDDEAQLQLLLQNARQILNIVEATFPHEDYDGEHVQTFAKPSSSGADLALKWRKVDGLVRAKARGAQLRKEHLKPLVVDFLKSAQEVLSSTASNYNITFLALGIAISTLAAGMTITCVHWGWPPTIEGCFFALVTIAYGIMMFASSYVEEEQHFWYWITGGWFVILYLTAAQNASYSIPIKSSSNFFGFSAATTIPLLCLHRISTHWTTTGVKYAGAPSISSSFLPFHPYILWLLVIFTYLYAAFQYSHRSVGAYNHDTSESTPSVVFDLRRMIEHVGAPCGLIHALALASVGLVFKVNFTAAEAPELLQGMDWMANIAGKLVSGVGGLDLVAQARVVFGFLVIAVALVVWDNWRKVSQGIGTIDNASLLSRLQPLLTLFLITQSRTQNVPLFLIFGLEQLLLRRLFSNTFETSILEPPNDHQVPVDDDSSSPEAPSLRSTRTTTVMNQAVVVALTTLLMAYSSFFALGGSNAISSIDLSNAYNGVAGYEVGMVGVLVFFGNWAGPIWWASQSWIWLEGVDKRLGSERERVKEKKNQRNWVQEERDLLRDRNNSTTNVVSIAQGKAIPATSNFGTRAQGVQSPFFAQLTVLTLFATVSLLAVQVACMALRTHLFIWTVFSPKYLYTMAWSCGWHLVWNCTFGGLLWRASAP